MQRGWSVIAGFVHELGDRPYDYDKPYYDVVPKAGSVAFFQHDIWHSGERVIGVSLPARFSWLFTGPCSR
jgi:hypothetical protein